jgi:hypothetical protein
MAMAFSFPTTAARTCFSKPADVQGSAWRPRAGARRRRRPPWAPRGRHRRSARTGEQQSRRPRPGRARHHAGRSRESAHQPGHPGGAGRPEIVRSGRGGDGRDHRATGPAFEADRTHRRSARQLRRPGHGNRDRAAQARCPSSSPAAPWPKRRRCRTCSMPPMWKAAPICARCRW